MTTIAQRLADAGIAVAMRQVHGRTEEQQRRMQVQKGEAMTSPERIWARPYAGVLDSGDWNAAEDVIDGPEYILATPEALAASPEVQALIEAAETRGWNAAIEAAAKLLGKYVDGLIEEYGNHEWDTNVTNLPEWVVTIEEEFETQSAAIRALKKGE